MAALAGRHQLRYEFEVTGFTITSNGMAGYPTAFVAVWSQGEGGAKIGRSLSAAECPSD